MELITITTTGLLVGAVLGLVIYGWILIRLWKHDQSRNYKLTDTDMLDHHIACLRQSLESLPPTTRRTIILGWYTQLTEAYLTNQMEKNYERSRS